VNKIKARLKEKSLSSEEKPRDLIVKTCNEKFTGVPYNYVQLRRTVVEYRNVVNFTYNQNYDIPEELRVTMKAQQFLQFDNGIDNEERIVIFFTKEILNYLKISKTWLCDGTFYSSPSSYEKLFTIQTNVRNKFISLVHCFMKKKTSCVI
jgi:hypothetical protein